MAIGQARGSRSSLGSPGAVVASASPRQSDPTPAAGRRKRKTAAMIRRDEIGIASCNGMGQWTNRANGNRGASYSERGIQPSPIPPDCVKCCGHSAGRRGLTPRTPRRNRRDPRATSATCLGYSSDAGTKPEGPTTVVVNQWGTNLP